VLKNVATLTVTAAAIAAMEEVKEGRWMMPPKLNPSDNDNDNNKNDDNDANDNDPTIGVWRVGNAPVIILIRNSSPHCINVH
jgi:hypothetical protein